MTTKKVLDEIWDEADAARTKAVEAYDAMVTELEKPPADVDANLVTAQMGQVYVNSLRFMAELWLTPTKLASSLAEADND